MYVNTRALVKIPTASDGAKIYIQKNGYVYYATKSYWDKEKKRMIDNRVIIGKLSDENPNLMYPNNRFAEIFNPIDEEVEALRSFYYSEKRREAGQIDIVISYAPYVVLKKCGEKCGIIDALNRSMTSMSDSIFAIAIHAIVSMGSTAQLFPLWSFDNYCGVEIPKSDSEISEIYKKIGENDADRFIFFELYKKNFHQIFPQSDERVIAFDSTNQVSESRNQTLAQYGKSKTKEKHPIINTALFVDEKTNISIYYEHFEGSVLDKSQTPYTLEKCKNLGYEKLFLMMDRGYYSFKNLGKMDNLGFGFGVMIPDTVGIVESLINLYRNKIKLQETYYIRECNVYGIQTSVTLKAKDGESVNYFAYIYYDDMAAFEERNSIHSKVNFYFEKAKKRKRYSEKMEKEFAKFAIIVTKSDIDKQTKKNFTLSVNNELVQKSCEDAGFFIILSNREMSATNMILIARGRDSSEKAFRFIKSHFNLSRTYTHTDSTYKGKMFVAFIALVLLQSFRWYLKTIFQKKSSETTSTLIGELHKYKIIQNKDGNWYPVYSMNKKQKEILECVGINEKDVEDSVRLITMKKNVITRTNNVR